MSMIPVWLFLKAVNPPNAELLEWKPAYFIGRIITIFWAQKPKRSVGW